jgi:hypothetical protein
MYQSGLALVAVSEVPHVSASTVWHALRRGGVTLRDRRGRRGAKTAAAVGPIQVLSAVARYRSGGYDAPAKKCPGGGLAKSRLPWRTRSSACAGRSAATPGQVARPLPSPDGKRPPFKGCRFLRSTGIVPRTVPQVADDAGTLLGALPRTPASH